MEERTIFTSNYRQKTVDIMRNNLQYILIGSFVLSFTAGFIFMQSIRKFNRNNNTLGSDDTKKQIEQAPVVSELAEKIQKKEFAYITPVPPETPKHPKKKFEENGQISAIDSDQVTYTQNKYIVQEGDSLASIAAQVYGDENAWERIQEANNLPTPDAIEVGMELVIPR